VKKVVACRIQAEQSLSSFAQSAVEVAAFVHGPDAVATLAHTPSSSSSPTCAYTIDDPSRVVNELDTLSKLPVSDRLLSEIAKIKSRTETFMAKKRAFKHVEDTVFHKLAKLNENLDRDEKVMEDAMAALESVLDRV